MISAKWEGNFEQWADKLNSEWKGSGTIAGAVVVPPELQWWYFHEYGVNHEWEIPKEPTGVAFPGRTGVVRRDQVVHPGFAPTHTVGTVQESLEVFGPELLQKIFVEADMDPALVKAAFMEKLMVEVKDKIVEQMSKDLRGHRPAVDSKFPKQSGKLQGKTASDVFAQEAVIEDRSE